MKKRNKKKPRKPIITLFGNRIKLDIIDIIILLVIIGIGIYLFITKGVKDFFDIIIENIFLTAIIGLIFTLVIKQLKQ